ncbi:MAG: TetR/AcrR family transcriptional regulator [Flavobacteriales bacterium]
MEFELDERGRELLEKSAHLFMRFGIKSMTMDDVSRQLGVSKKTLYLYVSDKNDLVVKTLQIIVAREKNRAQELCDSIPNAIDMLFELSKDISQKFGQMHPSINYDLEKYHPEAWAIYNEFQTKFITNCVEQNVQRGVEQGLYRDNLDPFLIAKFYSSKVHMCSDGVTFDPSKYSFRKIHLEMMRYHIRGIASEAGIEYLKEKVKQENIDL